MLHEPMRMGYSMVKRDAVFIVTILLLVAWFWSSIMTTGNGPLKGDIKGHRHRYVNPDNGSSDGCSDYRFMPSGTFPNVALVSVQGSGNTWVRWLLQSSTGFAAASVYNEPRTEGFRHEKCFPCNGQALVVKTHIGIQEPIDRAIIVIRNPYNALIAEFNRRKSKRDHVGHAPIELFSSSEWPRYVNGTLSNMFLKLPETYIDEGKPVHIVFYEHLKKAVEKELRKMLQFLKVDINEKRLACTLSNTEGAHHRKTNASRTFDPFTQEQRATIDEIISKVDVLLKDNGLPVLPEEYWTYPGPFPR